VSGKYSEQPLSLSLILESYTTILVIIRFSSYSSYFWYLYFQLRFLRYPSVFATSMSMSISISISFSFSYLCYVGYSIFIIVPDSIAIDTPNCSYYARVEIGCCRKLANPNKLIFTYRLTTTTFG